MLPENPFSKLNGDDLEKIENIPDEDLNAEEAFIEKDTLNEYLGDLMPEARAVVEDRVFEGKTLDEIAEERGILKWKVTQIYNKAINGIRYKISQKK